MQEWVWHFCSYDYKQCHHITYSSFYRNEDAVSLVLDSSTIADIANGGNVGLSANQSVTADTSTAIGRHMRKIQITVHEGLCV